MKPPSPFSPEGFPSPPHIRTLVVDDSDFMRAMLTLLLEESGFEVVGAADDGDHALQSVAALRPDLVLMDFNMPRMDGLQATRLIKQSGRQSGNAPVIVMVTSEDTEDCRSQAEDAGADGFVSKTGDLRVELKSTLGHLFFGNRESRAADLVGAGHEAA
jgi:CheY-like chemotaxis protein